jgi:flavorubredoxin
METTAHEIADGIFRLCTHVPEVAPPDGFTFCQFLVMADEPLLFHCGPRAMFPLVSTAAARITPLERLRWISFGHVEADECGSLNAWLAAATGSTVVYSALGCDLSVNDISDRPPKAMTDADVLDLGGKRIRLIATPHVPHGWDAQVAYEETTGTLFCGDLLGHAGNGPALTDNDILGRAIATEDMFHATSLGPIVATTIRNLAALSPRTLALMHGSSFNGNCSGTLDALANDYDRRVRAMLA